MQRLRPFLFIFVLIPGVIALLVGLYIGSTSHQITYKKAHEDIIAHYLAGQSPGTGYMQMVRSTNLYIVDEGNFTPKINGINTLVDGDVVSLVYDASTTTAIDVKSNFGTHLSGNAYKAAQITLIINGSPSTYTSTTYSHNPRGYYQNNWFTGGALSALGLGIVGSSLLLRRRKPREVKLTMTDATSEIEAIPVTDDAEAPFFEEEELTEPPAGMYSPITQGTGQFKLHGPGFTKKLPIPQVSKQTKKVEQQDDYNWWLEEDSD